MKKLLVALCLLGCAAIAQANTIYPALILEKMKLVKPVEHYGDEIYWVLTEFHSSGKNKQYTIPRYPVHWPSKAIGQIKNLKLWNAKLAEGQEAILYVELVEHDAPPFNVDDSIGSARIVIKNDKGKMKVHWQDSENIQRKEIKKGKQQLPVEQFTFHGEGAEYLVDMHFVTLNAKDYKPMKSVARQKAKLLHGH